MKASNAARNNRNNRVQGPAQPTPGPTPIPTTKRACDEELERLAVKEGRQRVSPQRDRGDSGPLLDDEDNDDEG